EECTWVRESIEVLDASRRSKTFAEIFHGLDEDRKPALVDREAVAVEDKKILVGKREAEFDQSPESLEMAHHAGGEVKAGGAIAASGGLAGLADDDRVREEALIGLVEVHQVIESRNGFPECLKLQPEPQRCVVVAAEYRADCQTGIGCHGTSARRCSGCRQRMEPMARSDGTRTRARRISATRCCSALVLLRKRQRGENPITPPSRVASANRSE